MKLQNLLKETIEILQHNNKTPDDVVWVGTRDGEIATLWSTFSMWAVTFDYDSGFGGARVNQSLTVVGDDWWLERGEYDGSEWWEFKTLPKLQDDPPMLEEKHLKESWNWEKYNE